MDSENRVPMGEKIASALGKARRQFFKMSSREKILVSLFALAVMAVWFSFQLDRHSAVSRAIHSAHVEAEDQQRWLDREASIQTDYDALILEIDLGKLLSKEEVRSRIDTLARSYGFNGYVLDETKTEEGAELLFHTTPFAIKKVSFSEVRKFTQEFKKELPYVSLERIVIRQLAQNDQFVDVNYILKSIEYVK